MDELPTTALPQPRPGLRDIPAYVSGKPPATQPGLTVYKLSSNELPLAPLPGVLAAAQEAAGQMNRYPDAGATLLYEALSAHTGVPEERLAVGPGSVALLYQLFSAYAAPEADGPSEVVYAWRSFEAYPIAAAAAGASSVQVPLQADGRHDLPAMLAAITDRTRIVVLCTPNNPTGPALPQSTVDDFLARVPARVLVVIDEAYREFVTSPDPVDGAACVARHPNVVATRTFSKAHGLAALRVGYAIAAPPIATILRATAAPFSVTTIAQAAAIASLAAPEAMTERVQTIVQRRTEVAAALRDQGWAICDTQGNFVWFDLPEPDAAGWFAAAGARAGISVRPFAGDGVRVTIGEPEACERLIRVAAEIRAESAGR